MRPNLLQFSADLVTFTEEILNGKLHFLWSVTEPSSPVGVPHNQYFSNFVGQYKSPWYHDISLFPHPHDDITTLHTKAPSHFTVYLDPLHKKWNFPLKISSVRIWSYLLKKAWMENDPSLYKSTFEYALDVSFYYFIVIFIYSSFLVNHLNLKCFSNKKMETEN